MFLGGGGKTCSGGAKPPKIVHAPRENKKPRFAVRYFKNCPPPEPNPVYAPVYMLL